MVDSNAEETKIYISLYIEDEFESLLVFELDCLTAFHSVHNYCSLSFLIFTSTQVLQLS